MSLAQVAGVRLPERERERVDKLVKMGYYMNIGDFLRDAVRTKLEEFEFDFVRDVDLKTAEREVLQFVKDNPNVYADEIARKLGLDIETVIKAINNLIEKKKVGKSI